MVLRQPPGVRALPSSLGRLPRRPRQPARRRAAHRRTADRGGQRRGVRGHAHSRRASSRGGRPGRDAAARRLPPRGACLRRSRPAPAGRPRARGAGFAEGARRVRPTNIRARSETRDPRARMRTWFPIAYLTLSALLVAWDVVLAGRIAQLRKAPWLFAGLTGLAGFLLIPAILLTVAASSPITGRALTAFPVQLLWPLTAVMFAVQAVYALVRRLVYPLLGVPIAVYNVIVAGVIVLRFAAAHGSS